MEGLNKAYVDNKQLPHFVEYENQDHLPVRVVQFGEGNFIRGFVDWMIQQLNKQGLFNGKVVAIQPTPHGKVVPKLNAQDGLYTLVLQGVEDNQEVNKSEIISAISKGINPYESWGEVLKYAESEDVEFIFSNTTEAGLTYLKEDFHSDQSPLSYPGKLTAFLYHRYQTFKGDQNAGLTIIPCELVEGNGDILKELVLKIAEEWRLPKIFINWLKEHNSFCNTLVDRIVPGYPKDNIEDFHERLGYKDQLIAVGEPYHLFAIEGGQNVADSIPFHKAGLNVKWGDVTPYRDLKVSILNAPHTMLFSVGYLKGLKTVFEVMDDQLVNRFVQNVIDREILPILNTDPDIKKEFASSVIDRFKNPFVKHYLSDLGLNAVNKYKSRVLPLFLHWVKEHKTVPQMMAFSLATLITYYKPVERTDSEHMVGKWSGVEYKIRDSKEAIDTLYIFWKEFEQSNIDLETMIQRIFENETLWGTNLNEIEGLTSTICRYVEAIQENGIEKSLSVVLSEAMEVSNNK